MRGSTTAAGSGWWRWDAGNGRGLKQSYQHVGKRLLLEASRYAHARQMKRARAATRKLRTQLGRVMREIERQVTEPTEKLAKLLETAHQIHAQQRHDKNKVYSVHEPEVQCIAKGTQLVNSFHSRIR